MINDNAPILGFDIGHGRLLLLQGQWLVNDDSLYGAPPSKATPTRLLQRPAAAAFIPQRLLHADAAPPLGPCLKIQVAGITADPRTVEALRPEYEFGDSELFDGDLAGSPTCSRGSTRRGFRTGFPDDRRTGRPGEDGH